MQGNGRDGKMPACGLALVRADIASEVLRAGHSPLVGLSQAFLLPAAAGFPASSAGLAGNSACVLVLPPLFLKGPTSES